MSEILPTQSTEKIISPNPDAEVSLGAFGLMLAFKTVEGVSGAAAAIIIGNEILDHANGFSASNIIMGATLAVINRVTNGTASFYSQISAQTATKL